MRSVLFTPTYLGNPRFSNGLASSACLPTRKTSVFPTLSHKWCKKRHLFFSLLMRSVLFAPLAVLGKFDLALDRLFILAREVIRALAVLTGEFYELFLCHVRFC